MTVRDAFLAIDTSTPRSVAGVGRLDVSGPMPRIARLEQHASPGHETAGRALLWEIVRMLDAAAVRLDEIGWLFVGVGPGSFTGLRVGLAAIKGLAFGSRELPRLYGVNSLAAAVRPHLAPNVVAAAVDDARKHEVYRGWYLAPHDGVSLDATFVDAVDTPAGAAEKLAARRREFAGELGKLIVVGNGPNAYPEFTRALLDNIPDSLVDFNSDSTPTAQAVAELALVRVARGDAPDELESLGVRYLRREETEYKTQPAL